MSFLSSRPAARWLAPVAVAAAVFGLGYGVNALTAAAAPSLPARSAAQLLVDLQTARLDGLSGTVVENADLGLPALSLPGGQGSADLSSLVNGSHTLRIWYRGPDMARVALLGTLGETNIIRNGSDVWIWESRSNKATHHTLPAGAHGPDHFDFNDLPKTPQEAADLALAAISPSTVVTTGSAAKVAGRNAYELILSPRDTASLVGQVRLAIDAEKHVPLRVQVYASKGDKPAFEVKFTAVSFAKPDPAQFTFNPPPGATVDEAPSGQAPDKHIVTPNGSAAPQFTVVGKGWTAVLVARLPKDTAVPKDIPQGRTEDQRGPGSLLDLLPKVSGAWGSGHIVQSKLFTVLLTDDGRILVGAVTPEKIQEVAADPAAALKANK
jgi:outer membrane lipoprotein-sorting protein